MGRIDFLRERAVWNGRRKNGDVLALLQCNGLMEHAGELRHNIKRAKVIRSVLERYPVEMEEGELLVGRVSTAETTPAMREELQAARETVRRFGLWNGAGSGGTDHRVADYEKVLNVGVEGLLEEIARREAEISPSLPDAAERTCFYQACRISLEGLLTFSARIRRDMLAKQDASQDTARRGEYGRLAGIFGQIPLRPARDFYEALQCVWLLQLVLTLTDDKSLSGRPDQYLYPYYLQGLADGSLTKKSVMELIENYYLKINELFDAWPASLIVGGQDTSGQPVYNELTEMFVEAIETVGLLNPSVAVGYNEHMPDALLHKCVDILSRGHARPSFFNDRIVIKGLTDAGMSIEDARNYIHSTCVEMTSIGCSNISVAHPYINTIKGMEFLLNDGKEMIEQEDRFGNFNPGIRYDLKELGSFDLFLDAYKRILGGMIREAVIWSNHREYNRSHYGSNPLMSCLTNDCIDRGKDSAAGGARYHFVYPCFPAFSSAVDALNAVRETVYEQGLVSLEELRAALAENFEGNEPLRQYLRNRCPKYGNDIAHADELAVDLYNFIKRCLSQYRTCLDGGYYPSYFSATMHGVFGKNTAATADGRLQKEALSECVGPVQGMDRKGPTAALNSIAKLDHSLGIGGIAANFRFSKALMSEENGNRAVAAFIRTFMEKGGFEIQLNVVDARTLLDAKQHPDQYRSLIVRVAGYSDYFVTLDSVIQDEIISRAEHGEIR